MPYGEESGPKEVQKQYEKELVLTRLRAIKDLMKHDVNAATVLDDSIKRVEENEANLKNTLELAENILTSKK